jgi:uncharacterized protein YndB with AHSA1/START domain
MTESTQKTDLTDGAESDILITRLINAPRELVWSMFTTPTHMMHWWGPRGFTTPVCEIDLRPGGIWHYVMRTPDGAEFAVDKVYREIVAPERLVYADVEESTDPSLPSSVHIITFEDVGGKTRLTMRTQVKSAAERDALIKRGLVQGVNEGLDRFEEYLKTL